MGYGGGDGGSSCALAYLNCIYIYVCVYYMSMARLLS